MVVIDLETLDLSLLLQRDRLELDRLYSACIEHGMFYLSNHGMSPEKMREALSVTRSFFRESSMESLESIKRTATNFRGYLDYEYTKNQLDWKKGFDFGAQQGSIDAPGMEGVNQWPRDNAHFEICMRKYFAHMERISQALLHTLAHILDIEPAVISAAFDEHTSMARLNFYPRNPLPAPKCGVHLHTDDGALTILLQDEEVNALQLINADNTYDDVPPKNDTFTIILGDLIQVLSNDRFVAPVHHALANANADRVSIPYFYYPSFDADIAPYPYKENFVAKYKPINWGLFRRTRFQGDHSQLEDEDIQVSDFRIN